MPFNDNCCFKLIVSIKFCSFAVFNTVIDPTQFIPILSGDNYKLWKDKVLLALGCMNLDMTLRIDEPETPTEQSTQANCALYERWERSNRLSMMVIKTHISQSIRGSIPECRTVKELMGAIDEQFVSSDKAQASTLMAKLCSMRLKGTQNVRGHIMEMRDISAQLKPLDVDFSESFLVHFILTSLPADYTAFKVSYMTHKEKWPVNELLNMCVQEEGRLNQEKLETVNLVSHKKGQTSKSKSDPKDKGKGVDVPIKKTGDKKLPICFFCKKKGHIKKECIKYKIWLKKNEGMTSLVCYESNFVNSHDLHNTWWIDSGSTIHVSTVMQGFQNLRKPSEGELCVYSGNKMPSAVEGVGTYRLVLHTGYVLNLDKTFYIPSFSKNLVSVSRLAPQGFDFQFKDVSFLIIKDSVPIGSGKLTDGLYCPSHTHKVVEARNARFLEDYNTDASRSHKVVIEEVQDSTLSGRGVEPGGHIPTMAQQLPIQITTYEGAITDPPIQNSHEEVVSEPVIQEPQQVVQTAPQSLDQSDLRRSSRVRKSAIPSDYVVYLQETDYMSGLNQDPISFSEAMSRTDSEKWSDAMKDELNSMANNQVWDLVELPEGFRAVGCKWVYKTKTDASGNIERFKARLVAKGFLQKEGIDYHDTFSPVSKKDSLRIIMALVAHFDLELHQMDVKTTFLNGELEEEVYMTQPEGFISEKGNHLVCKLKKSIYGLKQASRQWYMKFHNIITSFGFEENIVDQCIYIKVSGSKFTFLVLYVDDILLVSNNLGLIRETKRFLSQNFDMKDIGEASYVLGIEIHRDRSKKILGLSQKAYINKILERFNMRNCSGSIAPIVKGDKFSLSQCPKNSLELESMKNIPYASAVGSLVYLEVCTRPDIAFAVGMLGRYQSNPGIEHWTAAKKVMRYLQGTKDYMLTYRESDHLDLIGYTDADFAGCQDSRKSTSGYIFMLASGAVAWKSTKQTLTASSTMEAEFVACYEATKQALWLKNFSSGLRVMDTVPKPIKLLCDNAAAVFFSKNNKIGSRSKHIDIKYLVVRENVRESKIIIEHIGTLLMVADPMTKGLPPNLYKSHVDRMGLVNSFDD